jgi:short subunit dehydrogenase-like uncharacterized protein
MINVRDLLVVIILALVIFAALIFVFARGQAEPAKAKPDCIPIDVPTRQKVKQILSDGLDEALKEQLKHVFEVWMKDERGQPDRAAFGVRQAIRAYLRSREGLETWAAKVELKFCPE